MVVSLNAKVLGNDKSSLSTKESQIPIEVI